MRFPLDSPRDSFFNPSVRSIERFGRRTVTAAGMGLVCAVLDFSGGLRAADLVAQRA